MGTEVIHTSTPGYMASIASFYRRKRPFILDDDARLGIDPATQNLASMMKKAGLGRSEIAGVVLMLGVTGLGARLLWIAAVDPEPFTKAAFGTVLTVFGSGNAYVILTRRKPPKVNAGPQGVAVEWS